MASHCAKPPIALPVTGDDPPTSTRQPLSEAAALLLHKTSAVGLDLVNCLAGVAITAICHAMLDTIICCVVPYLAINHFASILHLVGRGRRHLYLCWPDLLVNYPRRSCLSTYHALIHPRGCGSRAHDMVPRYSLSHRRLAVDTYQLAP